MPLKRIGQASSITLQKITLILNCGEKLFKFFIMPSTFAPPPCVYISVLGFFPGILPEMLPGFFFPSWNDPGFFFFLENPGRKYFFYLKNKTKITLYLIKLLF
jgi:hypothetical protein